MAKQPLKELYSGECVSSMTRPNILVPLEAEDGGHSQLFPLLSVTHFDEETGLETGLFFDPSHGQTWWEWFDRAPSWMDPHLFVQMCYADERVREMLARAFEQNADPGEVLTDLLNEIFEEKYLVHVLDEFETAKAYIAEWMIRNHCYRMTDPNRVAKKKPRRKKIKWKEGDPGKRYRWLCKACGTRCGVHYFPIQYCRTCGKQDIVRQVTRDSCGYQYRPDRLTPPEGT